jgi:endonuclease/exonuclease/phosphatase family metal-dependent hydrolase
MNKSYLVLILLLLSQQVYTQNLSDLSFGTDSTLDVITWNMEWFPTNGQSSVDSFIVAIEALDADVIAVQEIYDGDFFQEMLDSLTDYDGYYIDSEYLELGFIYKNNDANFTIESIDQLFDSPFYSREFPRRPLQLELNMNGSSIYIINNHFKCCGDGYMDLSDPWDEETRRYDACILLDQYISTFHSESKVIITGDLNDLIQESGSNVFEVFIEDSANYFMSDMQIAEGSQQYWSYPNWPSHLDHFIITNEFENDINDPAYHIETLLIEDYLANGFSAYENNMSDHRPVAIQFPMPSLISGVADNSMRKDFSLFPNPARDVLMISSNETFDQLWIYDQLGKLIAIKGPIQKTINVSDLSSGLYIFEFKINNDLIRKRVIVQ